MLEIDQFLEIPINGEFANTLKALSQTQNKIVNQIKLLDDQSEIIGLIIELIKVYLKKSWIYLREDKYEESNSFGRYAVHLSTKYSLTRLIIITSIHLSHILITFKKVDSSRELISKYNSYQKSLVSHPIMLAYCLFVDGKLSFYAKDYQNALVKIKKAALTFIGVNLFYLVGLCDKIFGQIYMKMDVLKYAKTNLLDAKNIFSRKNNENNRELHKIEFLLGQCTEKLNLIDAEGHFLKSSELRKRLGLRNKEIESNEALAEYYLKIGEKQKGMNYKNISIKIENGPILQKVTEEFEFDPSEESDAYCLIQINCVATIRDTRHKIDVMLGPIILNIHYGEFVVFRGPSGHGKSTILNLITREIQPKMGYVKYKGKSMIDIIHNAQEKEKIVNEIGVLNLLPFDMKILDINNVVERIYESEFSDKFKEESRILCEIINYTNTSREKSGTVDGGRKVTDHFFEKQISRYNQMILRYLVFFLKKYPVIIADEPLEEFNPLIIDQMAKLFKLYHKETNSTILLITHFDKLADYSTKEVFIRNGMISDIIERPISGVW